MQKQIGFSLFFLLLLQVAVNAQSSRAVADYSNAQQFMNDANGRPLYMHTEYEIEGTPFFSNDYCYANLKVRSGKTYTFIKVKINLQDNLVIYDAGNGKELVATSPIEKIEFFNCTDPSKSKTLVSGYPPVDGQDGDRFYILLDSGKINLLKYIQVNYRDTKFYGKANTTRVFEQKEILYIYSPGKGMAKLPKDNESVINSIGNKREELQKFISSNDIKCRREEDLLKLFQYYNSL